MHGQEAGVSYGFQKNVSAEVVGSKAFNLVDYEERTSEQELVKATTAYLKEYRLQVQEHNYELLFAPDSLYGMKLRDVDRGEPMTIKAERAIMRKKIHKESISREEAELQGLVSIETALRFVDDGATLLWLSPPGPKEDGYGDYGFLFYGTLHKKHIESALSMIAIRIENPTIEECNSFFSALINQRVAHTSAEEFLANPYVFPINISSDILHSFLYQYFKFRRDGYQKTVDDRVIEEMKPAIKEFTKSLYYLTREERISAFHALENYTLERKAFYKKTKQAFHFSYSNHTTLPLAQIMQTYSYEPPITTGSCGSTARKKSSDPFSQGYNDLYTAVFGKEEEDEDDFGSRTFNCPECGHENKRPYNQKIPRCQNSDCPDPTKVAC